MGIQPARGLVASAYNQLRFLPKLFYFKGGAKAAAPTSILRDYFLMRANWTVNIGY